MKYPMLASIALTTLSAVATHGQTTGFRYVDSAGHTDLMLGETLLMRHMTAWDSKRHGETFKTYYHAFGFHGEGRLTKGPGGEFTHHRGFYLGWSQTSTAGKTMDSWHGSAGSSTRHIRYLPERELTGAVARRAAVTEWTMQDNSVIVRDTREVTVRMLKAGMLQIDWAITVASASGDSVVLKGDPHHAGFQFRADSSIKTFEYLGPADKTGTGDVWTMKTSNSWAVNKFALKGRGYAVMQMDHPLNPRPVQVSSRDYGRFGHFFETVIPADKPRTFHFRSLIVDTDMHGAPTVASSQTLYDEFARADLASSLRGTPLLAARNRPGLTLVAVRKGPDWQALEPMGLRIQRFGVEGRRAPQGVGAAGVSVLRGLAP
jgi:hypothetical protein